MPFTRAGLRTGARLALPFVPNSILFGLAVGAIAAQAGIGGAAILLMSAGVAAGSAQLAVLNGWSAPPEILALVLLTFAINVRFILLGLSLSGWLSQLPPGRLALSAWFLYDESWAVAESRHRAGDPDAGVLLGAGILLFIPWVLATAAGHGLGAVLPDGRAIGLDVLTPAVFLVLLVRRTPGSGDALPWLVSGGIVAAAWGAIGSWAVLAGGLVGAVVGGWRDRR